MTADATFERLHPRGRDGEFIEVGSVVKIFKSDGSETPLIGNVDAVANDGSINITLHDGEKVNAKPHQIEASKAAARLDEVPKATAREKLRPATPEDRKRLKIPPAWTDVVVAHDEQAPLQAMGRDAGGREQYRYTDAHHARQAEIKFARMKALHEQLPQLDAALARDAEHDGTAAAVYLMRTMGVRNGSDEDTGAKTFAYGASNLQARHVLIDGDNVTLDFDAKDSVRLHLPVMDGRLKRILRDRKAGRNDTTPLFDTNERKTNAYLKNIVGDEFKIKDLRTYKANAEALAIVESMLQPQTEAEFKKQRREVGTQVAQLLGNTPTVALASYINATVFSSWMKNAPWLR